MLRKSFITYSLFILSFCVLGQNNAIKHISVKEGLSNNYITDVTQDGQGFIWIATESGLNRFDGKNITVFNKSISEIVSNELNTLLYDHKENNLWIGSQRDGISILNLSTHKFTNLTSRDVLSTNDVTHLSHAADGGIWITHYHAGIEYLDRKTNKIVHLINCTKNGNNTQNWYSADDGKGNLYVGHANDGLSIIDIKSRTIQKNITHNPLNQNSLPSNTVRTIYIDSRNNVWIGTSNGLALFNPQTEECINFRHDPSNPKSIAANYVHTIREMRDGTLWISTDMEGVSILNLNNITLLDPKNIKFKNLSNKKGNKELSSPNVRDIFQDSFDNIWIGHHGRGLDLIGNKQPLFSTITTTKDRQNTNIDKPILALYIDENQNLWAGSESEILKYNWDRLLGTIDITNFLNNTNTNTYITCVKKDRNETVWFGTSNGEIFQINPENEKITPVTIDKTADYIYCLHENNDGTMWVGTLKGVFSYKNNEFIENTTLNQQLIDKTVFSIIKDNEERLWIGTFGKGIFIFDSNNKLIDNKVKENGFCSNAINHLFKDSRGGIWAATRNGVAHFHDGTNFTVYDEKNGLINAFARAVQEDNQGNIWISTNTGISHWDRASHHFNNYNHQDGAPIGDFTNGCVSIDKRGNIYFGSVNGLCRVNPMELSNTPQVTAPVQIIECRSLSKQFENESNEVLTTNDDNTIELPFNKNSLRISFSNPDFAQNEQVEYACLMEGLDNNWYNTQGDNQVTFRNIPPGSYKFKIKSRLKNQQWDEANIASLSFVIKPPIWLSWYAKLIYIIIITTIVIAIFRNYKNRIKLRTTLEWERRDSQSKQELNNERLKFYTNITHELRTPLTLILGPLEDLETDEKLPSEYAGKIKTINSSAKRLLNLINQVLDFRKTETQNKVLSVSKGNLSNLVTEIGTNYKNLIRNKDVSIELDIENSNNDILFDAEIITTILNNLLSNAVKYTTKGTIKLSLNTINDDGRPYSEIKVTDTGYGIAESDLPRIFDRYYQAKGKHQASGSGIGLALVKSLAEIHNAQLSVESTLGEGTTFTLRLSVDDTYPAMNHNIIATEQAVSTDNNNSTNRENNKIDNQVILIIEDDVDIRNYIASSLSKDYKTLTATNGLEGWQLTLQHIPNIIVSDVMMPEMDGFELCSKIKEDMRTSHIPVILLTAKDTNTDKEEGYESGADSYLTKPFSAKLLRSRIENLLELRRKLADKIGLIAKGNIIIDDRIEDETLKINKLDTDFLDKLTQIIENNIDIEELDITFIKEKMNMSYSTFYRKVKGLTGITPNEFVRKVRLKNSLKLLKSESYQISEVAYMSGFNDVVYFRKCFKDEYGMAPSDYAKSSK